MKTILLCLLVIVLLGATGAGAYFFGMKNGVETGKREANATAQKKISEARSSEDKAWEKWFDLNIEYGELSDQYNKLYSAAQAYVNQPKYTVRSPVTCNSYTYGMSSVSTTCY